MQRRQRLDPERQRHEPAPVTGHAERAPKDRLRGRRAETAQDFGVDQRDLRLPPRAARVHLGSRRLLVQPNLARRPPLEVLHRVGEVDVRPVDAGLGQRPIEQSAGRTDEGMALDVFTIAWNLAHQHEARGHRPFAEHGLRRVRDRGRSDGSRRLPDAALAMRYSDAFRPWRAKTCPLLARAKRAA